jgi:hypothetical protein
LALDTVYPLWIIISAQSYWPTQQDHSIPTYLEFPFEKFKFIGDLCCTNSLFRITTSVIPTSSLLLHLIGGSSLLLHLIGGSSLLLHLIESSLLLHLIESSLLLHLIDQQQTHSHNTS